MIESFRLFFTTGFRLAYASLMDFVKSLVISYSLELGVLNESRKQRKFVFFWDLT